jgi:taurine---2-oxoglutarate transaminase
MNLSELQELHRKHVITPWLPQGGHIAPVIVRGEGSYLIDEKGTKYLDLGSGRVAVNLGHGHPKVVQAIQEQAATLCYASPGFFNDKRAQLGAELAAISPWKDEGCRSFFSTAGGESNDDAVRLARAITGREKVLTAYRSFHGATGLSIALTGDNRRWSGEPSPPSIMRFFAPYPYRSPFWAKTPEEETARAIEHLEAVLLHENPQRIAAIMIEPVVGSNGVIIYPDSYLPALRAVTEKHGILLISDEVMAGFGRSGSTFGMTRFGVVPDMITFAKGITSAYIPLGGVMIREKLASNFDNRPFVCGHTYAGHPLCVATGLATLKVYREEGIYQRALEVEGWLREGLKAMERDHAIVGEARGLGAFFAIELVKDKASKEPVVPWHSQGPGIMKSFYGELRKRGVYTFGMYNCVMVAPPITASRADVQLGLEALDASLTAFAKEVI